MSSLDISKNRDITEVSLDGVLDANGKRTINVYVEFDMDPVITPNPKDDSRITVKIKTE